MSSEDIAEEIRTSFPGTEEIIVQYLAGYLVDDAGEDEDVLGVTRGFLESLAGDRVDALEELVLKLGNLLADQLNARLMAKPGPKLLKLDKVMDMSKGAMSNTIALSEGVDLESINKAKCGDVHSVFCMLFDSLRMQELRVWTSRNWRSRRQNSRSDHGSDTARRHD